MTVGDTAKRNITMEIILIIQAVAIIFLFFSLIKLGSVVNSQGQLLMSRVGRDEFVSVLKMQDKKIKKLEQNNKEFKSD